MNNNSTENNLAVELYSKILQDLYRNLKLTLSDPQLTRSEIILAQKSLEVALVEMLNPLVPMTPASIATAVVIARSILGASLTDLDLTNPDFVAGIDSIALKLKDIRLSTKVDEERLLAVVSDAIKQSETFPKRLRAVFMTIVLGMASSFAYDELKSNYESFKTSSDVLPVLIPGSELIVIADMLRIRTGPDRNATVLGMLPNQSLVVFYQDEREWYLVRVMSENTSDVTGWVHRDFLRAK